MLLNKKKCGVVANKPNSNIKIQDGTKVRHEEEVMYLRCMPNQKRNMKLELIRRIDNTAVTMKN